MKYVVSSILVRNQNSCSSETEFFFPRIFTFWLTQFYHWSIIDTLSIVKILTSSVICPNSHNRWFILFYHVWGPTWIDIRWNSIWLRAWYTWLHTTLEDLWPPTWFWRYLGTAFEHFLLGSHNFMVTALDSCVKWP